jgi:hypothetical protein
MKSRRGGILLGGTHGRDLKLREERPFRKSKARTFADAGLYGIRVLLFA